MSSVDGAGLDLSRRSGAREIMDDPSLGFDDFERSLRDLGRINKLGMGYRPTLAWIAECLRRKGNPPSVSVLDVGFGYGDTLRRLRTWSRKRSIALSLRGVDINPWAKQVAQARTPADWAIQYEAADIFDHAEQTYDIVVSGLFAHHLADDALIRFVRWMRNHARLGWYINDLHRDWAAYYGAKVLLPLMGCSGIVRHDGPLSVARARTAGEWRRILARAGLPPAAAEIRRHVPFRIGIGCAA